MRKKTFKVTLTIWFMIDSFPHKQPDTCVNKHSFCVCTILIERNKKSELPFSKGQIWDDQECTETTIINFSSEGTKPNGYYVTQLYFLFVTRTYLLHVRNQSNTTVLRYLLSFFTAKFFYPSGLWYGGKNLVRTRVRDILRAERAVRARPGSRRNRLRFSLELCI